MINIELSYKNIISGDAIESPLTDETALLVLPKLGGHGIFKILRLNGATIEEAVLAVLYIITGEDDEYESIKAKYIK